MGRTLSKFLSKIAHCYISKTISSFFLIGSLIGWNHAYEVKVTSSNSHPPLIQSKKKRKEKKRKKKNCFTYLLGLVKIFDHWNLNEQSILPRGNYNFGHQISKPKNLTNSSSSNSVTKPN